MIKRPINFSISLKLFLFLILICVVPLILLGILSYGELKTILEKEIYISSQNLMKEKEKSFEFIVEEIDGLITSLSSMQVIKDAVINDGNGINDFDKLLTQAKMGYILSGFANLQGLVSIDILSLNDAHYHVGDFLEKQEYDQEERQKIYNECLNSDRLILWEGIQGNINLKSKKKDVIVIAKILKEIDKTTLTEKPIGLLIVNYDIDAFYNHFNTTNEDDTEYIILDRSDRIVYHQDKSKIGNKPEGNLLKDLNNSSGSFTFNVEGKEQHAIYEKSNKNSWTLLALISEKSITSRLNGLIQSVVMIFIGAFFSICVFTLTILRKFVRPINKITNYFKETQNGTIDFKINLKQITNDEIGELCKWFNEFIKNLEQKRNTELELVKIKEAAEAANIEKSQFLANMSHELRTPLNGIIGFLELLSAMSMEREQANYLSQVKASTDSLLYVINDILDFSKIEADKLLIEKIPFNLHRLVEESVYLFWPQANEKGIELYSYISEDVPVGILGEPGRLRQVFNNLISNAVKFTEKGEVSFNVSVLKDSDEKVLLQFEVKDTGIGMSDETKEKLFQVFMQADASTTRKYGGTGLGLAISKKIVELLEGSIVVISELNKGSTFIITIELEKKQIEEKQIEEKQETPIDLNNFTVMIVENNERNRFIFQKYLGNTGCRVIEADDGTEAFKKLNQMPSEEIPQVILVDNYMPKMNGIEFGRQLLREYKDIKLIMIASSAQKGDAELVKNIGFSGYLSKPFRRTELLGVLSEVVAMGDQEAQGKLVTRYSIIEQRHSSKRPKILLVEDMVANQKLEMIVLKKLGYEVELSADGKQAVEICNEKKFHIILMDCQMPVMDGYEATELIRKYSALNNNTPIIAMTAHALEGDRDKCISAGMDDYISKPIVMDRLEEILNKHLNRVY